MTDGKLDAACLEAVRLAFERYRAERAPGAPGLPRAEGEAHLDHCGRFVRWLESGAAAGAPHALDEEILEPRGAMR